MGLQCFSRLERQIKREYNRPQLAVNDHNAHSAQEAVAVSLLNSIFAHCCGSHLAIIRAGSICSTHPDPCFDFGVFHSRPALGGSPGSGAVIK